MFAIVELKSRISNFQRKIGRTKVQDTINMDEEAGESKEDKDKEGSDVDEKTFFFQREDYQYRFCELAYIP